MPEGNYIISQDCITGEKTPQDTTIGSGGEKCPTPSENQKVQDDDQSPRGPYV